MKIYITGSAGFIGFHLSKRLLENGHVVRGIDSLTDYYDVNLKKDRQAILQNFENFTVCNGDICDIQTLNNELNEFKPNIIVHLAAQAGVRYSLENPQSYIETNINGTFNILEAVKSNSVDHLLMASTSSVYGANRDIPLTETQRTATPLSLYAASKSANEAMAHSYSHLYNIPVTMFRFFTVYGPWGRPDLALFKFVKAMLEGNPIDVYNNGDMYRDFTYIDDLVSSIIDLINNTPSSDIHEVTGGSTSPVAPFRVVNIGNSDQIKLTEFIQEIEKYLGVEAKKNFLPMQAGDVPSTLADVNSLKLITGNHSHTHISVGIKKFVEWYIDYYKGAK